MICVSGVSCVSVSADPLRVRAHDVMLRLRVKGAETDTQDTQHTQWRRLGRATYPDLRRSQPACHRYFPAQFSPVGPRERTPVATEFVSVVRFPAPGRHVARLGPNGATRGRRPRRGYHPAAPLATGGGSGRVGRRSARDVRWVEAAAYVATGWPCARMATVPFRAMGWIRAASPRNPSECRVEISSLPGCRRPPCGTRCE